MKPPENRLAYNEKIYIWSIIRQKWLVKSGRTKIDEEIVRQKFVEILMNNYGYEVDQMAEEKEVTGAGSGTARADILIYNSVEDKQNNKNPNIVIECKAQDVPINSNTYRQGKNYASYSNAKTFVATNGKETKYFEVDHGYTPCRLIEREDMPKSNGYQYDKYQNKIREPKISREKVYKNQNKGRVPKTSIKEKVLKYRDKRKEPKVSREEEIYTYLWKIREWE